MTNKKFYKSKKFVRLQTEWYDKLKKDGFEDLEWFNPETGLGQGSPFLKSENIPDSGKLRDAYHPELENHFRLCRNFKECGPFYPNLRSKFVKTRQYYPKINQLHKLCREVFPGLNALDDRDYKIWSLYTDGATIREISAELRRLFRLGKLPPPKKYKGDRAKRQPFSIYWVTYKLHDLKADMVRFNLHHEEGIDVWTDDEAVEDVADLMRSNEAVQS